MSTEEQEFYRKKITQTEYRGARYSSRHEKSSQFLDTAIEPVKLEQKHHQNLKEFTTQQLIGFLSKVVPEPYIKKVLTDSLLKQIFEKLKIK